jgi:hypothetical protein
LFKFRYFNLKFNTKVILKADLFFACCRSPLRVHLTMPTPQPPEIDASPVHVRNWFITLLVDLHGVPEAEAQEIASKWKYGRGSELLYYDVDTFRTIFGSEAGTLLFGHARRELRTFRRIPSKGLGEDLNVKGEKTLERIYLG